MSKKITKEMIISEILKIDSKTEQVLKDFGLHCLGCPSARGENLEDACLIHGIDVGALVEALNKVVNTDK